MYEGITGSLFIHRGAAGVTYFGLELLLETFDSLSLVSLCGCYINAKLLLGCANNVVVSVAHSAFGEVGFLCMFRKQRFVDHG